MPIKFKDKQGKVAMVIRDNDTEPIEVSKLEDQQPKKKKKKKQDPKEQ